MKKIFALLSVFYSLTFLANPGDSIHVVSHNAVTVITNPNTGSNGYKAWAVFPQASTPIRKIVATLSFKCAPGKQCGAWDYLDYVYIRRTGGQLQPSKDIECVRFITPYGNQFSSTWNFSWHMDVTDYSMFLRDSVEIEYIHTGYEGTNVGWQVTVDFMMIEGTPVADPVRFNQLWNGSFPYGNAANSIENYLTPDTVSIDTACTYTKLRLLHTGHGSDANGCSEFCSKYRTVYFDGVVQNTRARWRTCGNNALYPQGGTWVYDRANWCPGNIVQPDFTTSSSLTPGNHIFDIDMQTYSVSNPSANEVVDGQLFQFKSPNNSLDASIEEVYQPSTQKEYIRYNPVCDNPKVLVRNNGSTVVNSLNIKYGIKGSALLSYTWNGNLNFGDTSTVTLPGFSVPPSTPVNAIFQVFIDKVNGQPDQYAYDDSALVRMTSLPPSYDTVLIVIFRTNNYVEDSYKVTDVSGNVVWSRLAGNLTANTTYQDTIHVAPGCYDITMYDSGGDGLSFWANSAQGTGSFKLKRMYTSYTTYLKTFSMDFGSFFKFQFQAVPNFWSDVPQVKAPDEIVMDVFPNPAAGSVTLEYACGKGQKPALLVTDGLGRLVLSELGLKEEGAYYLDFSSLAPGVYLIRLSSENGTCVKKVLKQ